MVRPFRLLEGLLLVIGLLFAVLMLDIDAYGRHDHDEPADVIIVLGAQGAPNTQPGDNLQHRIEHAWRLWQADMAPYIITTGGCRDEPLSAAILWLAVVSLPAISEQLQRWSQPLIRCWSPAKMTF